MRVTHANKTDATPPTGLTTEAKALDYNQYKDKCNNPGLNTAWTSVVKFDDEYYPPEHTMTGPITYTIDATNAGTGNGRVDQVIGNGDTITFTGFTIRKSDLAVSTDTVTTVNGGTYTIVFLRRGSVSEVYLTDNQAAPVPTPVTFSNFRIEQANPDRVLFDADQVWTGTTFAGFTLASPSKTITGISGSGTSSGYFTVSAPYTAGDTSPTVAYDGTDDISGTGGDLQAFTATPITNNIGVIQLTAPTLNSANPGASQEVVLNFNNPNSGNEDSNLVQYKETSSGTWLDGVSAATGATIATQTGLTNGTQYDFRIVAKGSGGFNDSDPSNVLSATPSSGLTQLQQPLITDTAARHQSVTVTFTNANGANEDGNQLQYKLNSDSTWIDGPLSNVGETQLTQSGLTNSSLYDFRVIAKGSGSFYDSLPSTTQSETAGINYPSFANTHTMVIDEVSEGIEFKDPEFYFSDGAGNDLPHTILMWIKTTPPPILEQQYIRVESAGSVLFTLDEGVSGLQIRYRTDGGNQLRIDSQTALSNDTHYFIAISKAAGETINEVEMYLDGVLQTKDGSQSTGTYTGLPAKTADIDIELPYNGATYFGRAKYEMVRVFNRVLSQAEIQAHGNIPVTCPIAQRDNLIYEHRFNNNFNASIGFDGTQVGSPTFDTDIRT